MLELRVLGKIRDVPQAAWDALVGEQGSPFVEWTWLDCLEEAECVGAEAGWAPHHFALFRDGKLIAAAPAYLKGNSEGEFVFDWSWADLSHRLGVGYYPKLVFAVPFTPVTGERILCAPGEDASALTAAIADAARAIAVEAELSSVHLLFPPEGDAVSFCAREYLPRAGIQYHWHNAGYATMDDFLKTFSSKRRNQLRREMAQPSKDGVTIETLSPEALVPDVVDAMYGLYARTVDRFYYGRRYLTPRFFELVAERFSSRLAWVVARKENRILAGAFNVKKGNKLYGRYWGTTVDMPFLHFNVCYYHGIAQCIAEGLLVFEPGAGGEHKRVRGFDPTRTHSAHWLREPRLRRIIGEFLGRERAAVDAVLRGEDPSSLLE